MDITWIRDLFIIIFCVLGIGVSLTLTIMVIMLFRRVNSIMGSADGIVKEVRTTTHFVSDSVLRPAVRVASFISGVRRAIEAISGRKEKGKSD